MPQISNLFTNINSSAGEEEFAELLHNEHVRLERIVSTGQTTPAGEWYDQNWDEWVILLSGAAKLEFDEGPTHDLQPGDYLLIPSHCRHRVAWTVPNQATVWLAVHLGTTEK